MLNAAVIGLPSLGSGAYGVGEFIKAELIESLQKPLS